MKPYICSKELYCSFLQSTMQRYSATALSEISPIDISHDAVSRWLENTHFQPKDIWEKAKEKVLGAKGIVIVDDFVISKGRSEEMELTAWQYSGAEHDIVKGIGVVNAVWKDEYGEFTPFDYRIYYPKEDGKTKNDHLREMLSLARKRKVSPNAIVFDAWYSSLDNLKFIRDLGWIWVAGLKRNRAVNKKQKLEDLDFSNQGEQGLKVHLRGYGWIQVYKFAAQNGRIDYIGTNMEDPAREKVEGLVSDRWSIEVFHRELKQTCGTTHCQSLTGRAQRNHIGLSMLTWMRSSNLRSRKQISLYQQKWDIVKDAIAVIFRQQFLLSRF